MEKGDKFKPLILNSLLVWILDGIWEYANDIRMCRV